MVMVKENGMVMMSEKEYVALLEKSAKENNKLRRLLNTLIHNTRANKNGSTKVSRSEFFELYEFAVNEMFDNLDNGIEDEDKNEIWGHNVTVHWHGFYCNCCDGAVVANYIIPAIKGIIDEEDDEEWGNE